METLRKIVRNQYFPAGAVLAAVVLFWAVGLLGGLSLLNNNQPPLTTLTWMLFVYMAAVLTPLAGVLAAVDLVRRWRRNRAAAAAQTAQADQEQEAQDGEARPAAPVESAPETESADTAPTHQPSQAPKASRPKKNSKQTGRKQAA